MKAFTYRGPATGLTLLQGEEVLLWPNHTVQLPEDNPVVMTLVALGRLVPAAEQPE